MSDTIDFNTAGEQRGVIPAGTICTLQMHIRPGGVGTDNWLKRYASGSEGLDVEYVIVDGEHAKYKLWENLVLAGTTDGQAQMAETNKAKLRAILECARGIRPDDKSEAAQNARKAGYADFDGLRFIARLGVQPPKDGYPAKNTVAEVITADRRFWKQPEQLNVKPTNSGAPATTPTPPAGAIARPEWGR